MDPATTSPDDECDRIRLLAEGGHLFPDERAELLAEAEMRAARAGTDEGREAERKEKREALERYRQEWGREPV